MSKGRRDTLNEKDSNYWIHVLKNNRGFFQPERWVDYAREHNFKTIHAEQVSCCPDCGLQAWKKVGQYIYYSNLINLNACKNCHLLYSDTRINSQTVQDHFESTYKDEEYFVQQRKNIFEQIVSIASSLVPAGGKVIDLGGAKGHLMAALKRHRSDLRLIVNDLSMSKCKWAESHYQFRTICGPAAEVALTQERFDVVTMIDVIYYEPNISQLWHGLASMVADNGSVIIRVPNNLLLILLGQVCARLFTPTRAKEMCTKIKYFNPEHVFVFSRKYFRRRLMRLGFGHISFLPSTLLVSSKKWRPLFELYYGLARALHMLSSGRVIITPSLLVVGSRKWGAES